MGSQDDHTVAVGGARIPVLGCGTWELRGEPCARIVAEALKLGFRHIDTAQGYENEDAVGEGLRASGISRDEVFVTTKVRPQLLSQGVLQQSVEDSLKRLGIDRVDLLLIHWPNPEITIAESMAALSDAKRRGLARHIGVSNFTIATLAEAIRVSPEPFVTNQVEYHPYLDQRRLLAAIRGHGLAITAYCPIALGEVVGDPVISGIAKAHGKTEAQVTLRWLIQQGDVIAIPRTSKVERLRENLDVFDFALSAQEMEKMGGLTRPGSKLINQPGWVPEWD
jgi:diketogulonate reductase-like aldo/keto reductase